MFTPEEIVILLAAVATLEAEYGETPERTALLGKLRALRDAARCTRPAL